MAEANEEANPAAGGGAGSAPAVDAEANVEEDVELNDKLFAAAKDGDMTAVNAALAAGATNLDKALQLAAKSGHLPICELFVERGATNPWAMVDAAREGHLPICELLVKLEGARLDSALTEAAEYGHLPICELLLERGAINLNDALRLAAYGGNLPICELLLAHGATDMDWALFHAAEGGHLTTVAFLVERGATSLGRALRGAAWQGQLTVVQLLAGRVDVFTEEALETAAGNGHREVVDFLLTLSPPQQNLNAALVHAVADGEVEMCTYLLSKGAHPTSAAMRVAAFSADNDDGYPIRDLLLAHGGSQEDYDRYEAEAAAAAAEDEDEDEEAEPATLLRLPGGTELRVFAKHLLLPPMELSRGSPKKEQMASLKEEVVCAICRDDKLDFHPSCVPFTRKLLRKHQQGFLVTVCKHVFHEQCLTAMLSRSTVCPLCRTSLV